MQDLADPLQWNPYSYSNNTPITRSDPTGEFACIDSCDWDRRRYIKAASSHKKKGPVSLKGNTRGRNPYSGRVKRWRDPLAGKLDQLIKRPGSKQKVHNPGPPIYNNWTRTEYLGDQNHLLDGLGGVLGGAQEWTERKLKSLGDEYPQSLADTGSLLRGAGKIAGFLSIADSIQSYNYHNNERGHRGWDANWRTGANDVVSETIGWTFTTAGVRGGAALFAPSGPGMIVGGVLGGLGGVAAGALATDFAIWGLREYLGW